MPKPFSLRLFIAGLVLSACMAVPQTARAQGSSLFGSSGLTNGGTGGISGGLTGSGFGSSGSSGGRSGGLGSSGSSGFGGLGGAGSSAFGSTGLGGMTGGGNTGFGSTGMSGMTNPFGTTNNSGMVGRNSGAFAGNSQAGQAGTGNSGGATRNFGRGNNASQRNGGSSQNQQNERTTSTVRPRQKVAFDYNVKSPTVVATKMTTRLGKISQKNPSLKNIQVLVDGEQLVLSGKVETAEQSQLAANLLRLEPGVRSIRNELQVEKAATPE